MHAQLRREAEERSGEILLVQDSQDTVEPAQPKASLQHKDVPSPKPPPKPRAADGFLKPALPASARKPALAPTKSNSSPLQSAKVAKSQSQSQLQSQPGKLKRPTSTSSSPTAAQRLEQIRKKAVNQDHDIYTYQGSDSESILPRPSAQSSRSTQSQRPPPQSSRPTQSPRHPRSSQSAQSAPSPRPSQSSQPAPSPRPPVQSPKTWTSDDDRALLSAFNRGLSYAQIAQDYFGNRRSLEGCRTRHKRLLAREVPVPPPVPAPVTAPETPVSNSDIIRRELDAVVIHQSPINSLRKPLTDGHMSSDSVAQDGSDRSERYSARYSKRKERSMANAASREAARSQYTASKAKRHRAEVHLTNLESSIREEAKREAERAEFNDLVRKAEELQHQLVNNPSLSKEELDELSKRNVGRELLMERLERNSAKMKFKNRSVSFNNEPTYPDPTHIHEPSPQSTCGPSILKNSERAVEFAGSSPASVPTSKVGKDTRRKLFTPSRQTTLPFKRDKGKAKAQTGYELPVNGGGSVSGALGSHAADTIEISSASESDVSDTDDGDEEDDKAVNGGAVNGGAVNGTQGREPPYTQLSLDEDDDSSELVSDEEEQRPVEMNGATHDISDHEELSDSGIEAYTPPPATTVPKLASSQQQVVSPIATDLPSSPPVLPVLPASRESAPPRPPPPMRSRFPSFQEIQEQVGSQELVKPKGKAAAKQEKPLQNGTKPPLSSRTEVNDGSYTDTSTEGESSEEESEGEMAGKAGGKKNRFTSIIADMNRHASRLKGGHKKP